MNPAHVCLLVVVGWLTLFVPVGFGLYAVSLQAVPSSLLFWLSEQWLWEGLASIVFLGILAVWSIRRQRPPRLPPWWTAWLVWIGWGGLGLIWSIDHDVSLRSWLAVTSYGLLALLASAAVRTSREASIWVRFLVVVAIAISLHSVLQFFGGFEATSAYLEELRRAGQLKSFEDSWTLGVIQDIFHRKRLTAVFGWPNLFAGFLLLFLPPALAVAFEARTRAGRWGWGLGSGLLVAALLGTLSMSGWFAAILTGSVVWWAMRRAQAPRGRSLTSFALAAAVGLTMCGVVGLLCFVLAEPARPMIRGSLTSRLVYLEGAANILSRHPIQGTGPGTFGLAYGALRPQGQHASFHAHNTLAELGAEGGLIGLGSFLAFLWPVGRLIVGALRAPPTGGYWLRRGLAIGVLGFFIHSVLELTFFEPMLVPFWWLALGLLSGSSLSQLPVRPDRRVKLTRLFPLAAGVGLVAVLRLAVADVWAARGEHFARSSQFSQAIEAFVQAQRWDPWCSRYPKVIAEEAAP